MLVKLACIECGYNFNIRDIFYTRNILGMFYQKKKKKSDFILAGQKGGRKKSWGNTYVFQRLTSNLVCLEIWKD